MRRYPAQDMEPAERDPKKLFRTAAILVGVMLVGAVVVLVSYNRTAARQAEDDRPAITDRLNGNFRVWRQDESEAGILDLEGKVMVLAPVVFSQPEDYDATLPVLQRLARDYAAGDELRIVMITLDPENEPPLELARWAGEIGAELPFWWVAGAREESVHKFFKNRLNAGFYPHRDEGRWIYDPSLVVIDRDRHIRKATVRGRRADGRLLNERYAVEFDFEQAQQLDAEGVPAGYEWDEQGNREPLEIGNVERLEEMLRETIERLIEGETEETT